MNKKWDMIEVLRYARHDWLNKIQLIKGNLTLNKLDRVNTIIDEIVAEAQAEANLSNLNIPKFASLLLTYNWENHFFQLEYDVLDVSNCDYVDDERLTDWTASFFVCLNNSIECYYENHLSITIDPQIEGVRFFFDFKGIITNKDQIKSFLTGRSLPAGVYVQELTEKELSFEAYMPAVNNG